MKSFILFLFIGLSFHSFAQDEELPEIEAEIDAQYADSRMPMEPAPSQDLLSEVPQPGSASSAPEQTVNSEPINIDGYIKKEEPIRDQELVQIQSEISRQKKEVVLNKEKAKHYNELSKSVEVLTETTEEMLEEKRAAQQQIAEYNAKVKCLQEENPGRECDKYVKRR